MGCTSPCAGRSYINARVLPGADSARCSHSDDLKAARVAIGLEVHENIANQLQSSDCGGLGWRRVGYLDMTEDRSNCPDGLTKFHSSGKRLCGRRRSPSPAQLSCASAVFNTGKAKYSRVCGRIVGYAFGTPYAFLGYTLFADIHSLSVETYYVDGVTVTHGPPGDRQHVWTFAAGKSEKPEVGAPAEEALCPCNPNSITENIQIPDFIGQDYFCEAGSINLGTESLHEDDPLWDGAGCFVNGNTCCEFNSPPYFAKVLPNATLDNLEVRTCGYDEQADTFVEFIELYVQ